MGFNETVHAYIAAKFYTYMTEEFGERGKKAFLHGTQGYAYQRGRRMAQRAIRDGYELNQAAYNGYGEWATTDDVREMGCAIQSDHTQEGIMKITACPWHAMFKKMGATEAGTIYCGDLDASISRGFNPELGYKVDQTLHTADCCIHRVINGDINASSGRTKAPDDVKDFNYHCAHLYFAYAEVCAAIFEEAGEAVNKKVLADFTADYGKEMADDLMKYEGTNFNVCR